MKRFYKNWPMHNIVAHPLMQILEWIGLVSMADKLHDATLPPNAEITGCAAVRLMDGLEQHHTGSRNGQAN